MPTECHPIHCIGEPVELQAAASGDKLATFSGTAYSGGAMKVSRYGSPVVIDLAGLRKRSDELPILLDHSTDRIVGHADVDIGAQKIKVAGTISGGGDAAREVITSGKQGFPWKLSVGAHPEKLEFVPENSTVSVNGRSFKGPVEIARSAELVEISFVVVAADNKTSATVAASLAKGTNLMSTDNLDPIQAERARMRAVNDILANYKSDVEILPTRMELIRAGALDEGWTAERVELELLKAERDSRDVYRMRNERPVHPEIFASRRVGGPAAIEAAAAILLGVESLAEKQLGEQAMEQGRSIRCTHLMDLVKASLVAENRDIPSDKNAMIRAGFSTVALPTALGNTLNTIVIGAYNESPATWQSFCAIKPANDFRTHTSIRPSVGGQLELTPAAGEIHHSTMGEGTFTYKVDTYSRQLRLTRRDVIDDNAGVFDDLGRTFGRMARRRQADLVYEVLFANAGSFFSEAHGNLLTDALDVDALADAIVAMLTQRDDDYNDLDIRPVTLLVPPELQETGKAALESEYLSEIAASRVPTGNALRNSLKLETEPRISNIDKFGDSTANTNWYVFGSPVDAPMVAAFLNGQQAPVVEFFGLDADPNTLGVSWRVYSDFGASLGDFKAACKSTGAGA